MGEWRWIGGYEGSFKCLEVDNMLVIVKRHVVGCRSRLGSPPGALERVFAALSGAPGPCLPLGCAWILCSSLSLRGGILPGLTRSGDPSRLAHGRPTWSGATSVGCCWAGVVGWSMLRMRRVSEKMADGTAIVAELSPTITSSSCSSVSDGGEVAGTAEAATVRAAAL
jgi:hypothetical protein